MSFRTLLLVTALAALALAARDGSAPAAGQPASASPAPVAPSTSPAVPASPSPIFPQPKNWPAILHADVSQETLGPGVGYQRWLLATNAGPLQVSLATVDLRNPYVKLGVASQREVIVGPGEPLSSMADREHAEVAVNADYFDINESGSPLNLLASDGQVLHEPDHAAVFALASDGRIYMGPLNWSARLTSPSGAALAVNNVNEWSPSVDVALLTPQFGSNVAPGAAEMVLAPSSQPNQYQIITIQAKQSLLTPLSGPQISIVARGAEAGALLRGFHKGDVVTLESQTQPALDLRLGIGGGPLLVQSGLAVQDPAPPAPEETDVRNPVTGVGISRDASTLWLVVVDGRAPARSIGLTRPQFASLFMALGADTAMAFDSGGSSEMVVRHLGKASTDVAGSPSDGRERSIADALLVANSAATGSPVALILRPAQAVANSAAQSSALPAVLAGSSLSLAFDGIDANDQPVAIDPSSVKVDASPAGIVALTPDGVVNALRPGSVVLKAGSQGATGAAGLDVVASIERLAVVGPPTVPVLSRRPFTVSASTDQGDTIAVDRSAVTWSADGGASIDSNGELTAPPVAARIHVTARAGGALASALVLCGEHSAALQPVPPASAAQNGWQFASRPDGLPGTVDERAAPDKSAALRLAYDFSDPADSTRAAYAQTSLALPGQPMALLVDAYGDRGGEWLRGGYRNADGNEESMTIARHVDWKGWKTLRAAIPPQMTWPVTWTRLYVVEPSKAAHERGSLWFRNLVVIYPGP